MKYKPEIDPVLEKKYQGEWLALLDVKNKEFKSKILDHDKDYLKLAARLEELDRKDPMLFKKLHLRFNGYPPIIGPTTIPMDGNASK